MIFTFFGTREIPGHIRNGIQLWYGFPQISGSGYHCCWKQSSQGWYSNEMVFTGSIQTTVVNNEPADTNLFFLASIHLCLSRILWISMQSLLFDLSRSDLKHGFHDLFFACIIRNECWGRSENWYVSEDARSVNRNSLRSTDHSHSIDGIFTF